MKKSNPPQGLAAMNADLNTVKIVAGVAFLTIAALALLGEYGPEAQNSVLATIYG